MFTYILQYLSLISASQHHARCKAAPGTSSWPLDHEWARLNTTLSGQLLKPSPPGAVCHPTQSTFDPLACPAVLAGWQTTGWHSDDPVSVSENNWNNDTCLPVPTYPCSGQGYPIYVVNATCATDVKKGVDFAREKNIRLIVKGTGHDYLGRLVPFHYKNIANSITDHLHLILSQYGPITSVGWLFMTDSAPKDVALPLADMPSLQPRAHRCLSLMNKLT